MNPFLQTTTHRATLLLFVVTAASVAVEGTWFAAGVLLGGLLPICSLIFGAMLTAPRPGAEGGMGSGSPVIPLLISLKFPLVGLLAIALLTTFPPLSVLIGGGLLVLVVVLNAVMRLHAPTGGANGI